jgi:hypothetical protein
LLTGSVALDGAWAAGNAGANVRGAPAAAALAIGCEVIE